MMWPPPRSILFPYTTLFRSHHVERQRAREPALDRLFAHGRKADGRIVPRAIRTRGTGRPLLDVEQVVDRHHLDDGGTPLRCGLRPSADDAALAAVRLVLDPAFTEIVIKLVTLAHDFASDGDARTRRHRVVALVADDELRLALERDQVRLAGHAVDL